MARFSKASETFRARKFLVDLYLKRTSVHIKKMRIKQLCNYNVWDFAAALRVQKHFGTFEKWASVTELLRVACFIKLTRLSNRRRSWVVDMGHGSLVRDPPCIHIMYAYFYAVSNALSQQRFSLRSLFSVYAEAGRSIRTFDWVAKNAFVGWASISFPGSVYSAQPPSWKRSRPWERGWLGLEFLEFACYWN